MFLLNLKITIFLLIVWIQIKLLDGTEVQEEILLVARCRVNCLEKIFFQKNPRESETTKACWQTCGYLYQEFDFWNRFCLLKEICNHGCQIACNFQKSRPTVSNRKRQASFEEHPKASLSPSFLIHMKWGSVRKETSKQLVYVLLLKDVQTKNWNPILQTASLSTSFSAVNISEASILLLLAVDINGIIAEEKFSIRLPTKNDDDRREEFMKKTRKHSSIVKMDFTEIDAILTLKLQLKYTPKSKKMRPGSPELFVHWFLEDCGVYTDAPQCNLPPQHYGPIKATKIGKKILVNLKNVLYNSLYTVRIEGSQNYEQTVEFRSPKCYTPDDSFRRCNRIEIISQTKERKRFPIHVDSLVFNLNLNKFVANFSWNASSADYETVRYIVSWLAPNDLNRSDILLVGKAETLDPEISLKLEPSFLYKLEVEAIYGVSDNATIRSETLYVNTSHLVGRPSASIPGVNPSHTVTLNIFAVVAFALVLSSSILFTIICTKKRKQKNIIITKNIVSKSNSYKSNVSGCKTDYTSTLKEVNDEWELDPSHLEFNSPLGQGAFGKVISGYYGKRKVAIKVVKDSAPLSYKEDLLAEMELMKKIGSHPNIVAMIGTCTKSEPIAIIMEYVPNGNLLNYLIKCRHETEDGYAEMDGTNAEKNSLTLAQMLSFARQISMAMQYLSENKYVHRDLAARNVLLDENRMAKICDFGLSRDIYKDNIYQKLTSGKLPIKWMAIESLRDRIFTTYSDVWSFGILLWEIVTMGASPYPGIALADLYQTLSTGYRMEKPSSCSEELYGIMRLTWKEKPKERPTFHQLRTMIESLMHKNSNYLDLGGIQDPTLGMANGNVGIGIVKENEINGDNILTEQNTINKVNALNEVNALTEVDAINGENTLTKQNTINKVNALNEVNASNEVDVINGENTLDEPNTINEKNALNEVNVLNEVDTMNEENTLTEQNTINEKNALNEMNALNEVGAISRENTLNEGNVLNETNALYQDNALNEVDTTNEKDTINGENSLNEKMH